MHEALDSVIMVDDQDSLDGGERGGANPEAREVEDTLGCTSWAHGAARALLLEQEEAATEAAGTPTRTSTWPAAAKQAEPPADKPARMAEIELEVAAEGGGMSRGGARGECEPSLPTGGAAHLAPPAESVPSRPQASTSSVALSEASETQQLIGSGLAPSRSAPSLKSARDGAKDDGGAPPLRIRRPSLGSAAPGSPTSPPRSPGSTPDVKIALPGSAGVDPRESRSARAASALTFGGIVGGSTPSTFLYDPAEHHSEDKEAGSGAHSPPGRSPPEQGKKARDSAQSDSRDSRESSSGENKYKERLARARRFSSHRPSRLTSPSLLLDADTVVAAESGTTPTDSEAEAEAREVTVVVEERL